MREVRAEVIRENDSNAVRFGVTVSAIVVSKGRAEVTDRPFDIASHAPPTMASDPP